MENCNSCDKHGINIVKCPCRDSECERAGTCCDCIAHHKKQGNLPMCLR